MRRLHPLSAVTRMLRYGVNGFSIPFFLSLFGGSVLSEVLGIDTTGTSIDLVFVLAPVGFVVGIVYGYLVYTRFEYELTENTLDVASGVIGRTEREIPIRRIQNVDVQQNLFHRLFDVAVVRIETAGGGGTEAELSVVSREEADRLQREIRARRNGSREAAAVTGRTETTDETVAPADRAAPDDRPGAPMAGAEADTSPTEPAESTETATSVSESPARETGTASAEAERTLFTLSPVDLLILALARFRFGSFVIFVIAAPIVGDVAIDGLLRVLGTFGGPTTLDPDTMTANDVFVTGIVGTPLVLAASYVVSAVVSIQEFYGFELARRGEDLVYERGLLQRYSGSIPTDKVQTVSLTETVVMRPLGYAALGVETAGYAGQRAESGSQSAVPLAPKARVLELADDLADIDLSGVEFERAPKRARRRYAVRYSIAVTVLLALAWGVSQAVPDFTLWYLFAVLYLLAPVAAHYKWANRGYYVGEDHVVVRSGFWNRQTEIVPYYRLQTVVSEATVFQRRLSLATLVADTASSATLTGSAPTAFDLDATTVDELQQTLRERLQTHLHG
ncbi:PH domain-containing protein [Haloarchaeobius sp. DFWS5]|uniref:PH domain-containing protein n=1 Tax=Haloarchaeobius sp. DFWS5 TaxID=3446114 RepID=UPI003EBEE987